MSFHSSPSFHGPLQPQFMSSEEQLDKILTKTLSLGCFLMLLSKLKLVLECHLEFVGDVRYISSWGLKCVIRALTSVDV